MKFCYILGLLSFLFFPEMIFAHAGRRGFVMLLPTEFFIMGGAVIVALTFLLVIILAKKKRHEPKNESLVRNFDDVEMSPTWSYLSLMVLAVLVIAGFIGTRDPLENPLPLMLWVGWWVGWTFLTALFGDLWHWIQPWHALDQLLRSLPGIDRSQTEPSFQYPDWLGYWPAVVFFMFFAWIELIHPSPMDPDLLATKVLLYIMLVSSGMLFFGKTKWLQYAEPFSVFFRMVGWISPLEWKAKGLKISGFRWPCSKLMDFSHVPFSGVVFILLVLSTVSFDGLSRTFWWMGLLGENPLEYPGRTKLMLPNTAGMFFTFLIFLLFYGLTQIHKTSNSEKGIKETGFVFSIIPIAFGYHFAHYLPNFLVDIQYTFISLADPFELGWNLFGLKVWDVKSSFLTHHESVIVIWYLQISGIVLAHIAAVLIAHFKVLSIEKNPRVLILSQIPATLLMIAYTVLGLWLLSTPIAA